VVALAPTHLTSAAIALCARRGIELVVVPSHAGVAARLGASEAGLALRRAQTPGWPPPARGWRS
jgi:CRISPR/Cas system-associated endonuclease Cas1